MRTFGSSRAASPAPRTSPKTRQPGRDVPRSSGIPGSCVHARIRVGYFSVCSARGVAGVELLSLAQCGAENVLRFGRALVEKAGRPRLEAAEFGDIDLSKLRTTIRILDVEESNKVATRV